MEYAVSRVVDIYHQNTDVTYVVKANRDLTVAEARVFVAQFILNRHREGTPSPKAGSRYEIKMVLPPLPDSPWPF